MEFRKGNARRELEAKQNSSSALVEKRKITKIASILPYLDNRLHHNA
jgi:hypothetical protein